MGSSILKKGWDNLKLKRDRSTTQRPPHYTPSAPGYSSVHLDAWGTRRSTLGSHWEWPQATRGIYSSASPGMPKTHLGWTINRSRIRPELKCALRQDMSVFFQCTADARNHTTSQKKLRNQVHHTKWFVKYPGYWKGCDSSYVPNILRVAKVMSTPLYVEWWICLETIYFGGATTLLMSI